MLLTIRYSTKTERHMKRKIRNKQNIRRQQMLEKQRRIKMEEKELQKQKLDDEKLERVFGEHPFWKQADIPDYVFVFVKFHYACEIRKPKSFVLLYDRLTHEISIVSCHLSVDFDGHEYNYTLYMEQEVTKVRITDHVDPLAMHNCSPECVPNCYDSPFFRIFFRCGGIKQHLCFKLPNSDLYGPFRWIVDSLT